jgi:hypothetical protein
MSGLGRWVCERSSVVGAIGVQYGIVDSAVAWLSLTFCEIRS